MISSNFNAKKWLFFQTLNALTKLQLKKKKNHEKKVKKLRKPQRGRKAGNTLLMLKCCTYTWEFGSKLHTCCVYCYALPNARQNVTISKKVNNNSQRNTYKWLKSYNCVTLTYQDFQLRCDLVRNPLTVFRPVCAFRNQNHQNWYHYRRRHHLRSYHCCWIAFDCDDVMLSPDHHLAVKVFQCETRHL